MIHRAMREASTRLYLKIGTTGTGGMGLNIPYTHSEDRPSAKLMSKTAVAFAHTGLLIFDGAYPQRPVGKRTKAWRNDWLPPGGIQSELKCEGRPQFRYESQMQGLNGRLTLRGDENQFTRIGKIHMAGVDTGENGFFARGEFEAITHINQMEFVTPEEIAQQALLEIKGQQHGLRRHCWRG